MYTTNQMYLDDGFNNDRSGDDGFASSDVNSGSASDFHRGRAPDFQTYDRYGISTLPGDDAVHQQQEDQHYERYEYGEYGDNALGRSGIHQYYMRDAPPQEPLGRQTDFDENRNPRRNDSDEFQTKYSLPSDDASNEGRWRRDHFEESDYHQSEVDAPDLPFDIPKPDPPRGAINALAVLLFLLWSSCYFCRDHILVSSPNFQASEGVTKQEFGNLMISGYVGYILGKLIWGKITDHPRVGGRKVLIMTVMGSFIFTLVFAFGDFFLSSSTKSLMDGAGGHHRSMSDAFDADIRDLKSAPRLPASAYRPDYDASFNKVKTNNSGIIEKIFRPELDNINTTLSDIRGSVEHFNITEAKIAANEVIADIKHSLEGPQIRNYMRIWILLRFCQAGGWLGIVNIAARYVEKSYHGKFMALVAQALLLGDAGVRMILGSMMKWMVGAGDSNEKPKLKRIPHETNTSNEAVINNAQVINDQARYESQRPAGIWRQIMIFSAVIMLVSATLILCLMRTPMRRINRHYEVYKEQLLAHPRPTTAGHTNSGSHTAYRDENDETDEPRAISAYAQHQRQMQQMAEAEEWERGQQWSVTKQDSSKAPFEVNTTSLFCRPRFYLLLVIGFQMDLLRESVSIYSAPYLQSLPNVSLSEAAMSSSIFSAAGSVSTFLSGCLIDRGYRYTFPIWIAIALCGFAGILRYGNFKSDRTALVNLADPDTKQHILVSLGLVGFGLQGAYTLKIGQMTLDVGGRNKSALACGIIDAIGYMGAILIIGVHSYSKKKHLDYISGQPAQIASSEFSRLFHVNYAVCMMLLCFGFLYACSLKREAQQSVSSINASNTMMNQGESNQGSRNRWSRHAPPTTRNSRGKGPLPSIVGRSKRDPKYVSI